MPFSSFFHGNGSGSAAQQRDTTALLLGEHLKTETQLLVLALDAVTAVLGPVKRASIAVGTRNYKTPRSRCGHCHLCPSPVPEDLRPGKAQPEVAKQLVSRWGGTYGTPARLRT